MALIDMERRDGMQLGGPMDRCRQCNKDLEYEECFAIGYNGNRLCYCKDCFEKMLGKYKLVDFTMDFDAMEIAEPPEEFKEEAPKEEEKEEETPKKTNTRKSTKKE